MNTKNINSGVWPTMLTLYDKNGKVDIDANVKLAERLVDMGSDGIFGICQSSEMFFLSIEEKVKLAKAVKEVTDNRASLVISGHTADSLDEQISDLKKLASVGADALVLVTNRLDTTKIETLRFIAEMQKICHMAKATLRCSLSERRISRKSATAKKSEKYWLK